MTTKHVTATADNRKVTKFSRSIRRPPRTHASARMRACRACRGRQRPRFAGQRGLVPRRWGSYSITGRASGATLAWTGCIVMGQVMTLGSHQQCVGKLQNHITPKWIIDALGPFDFDPCAADPRPWDCARRNITEREDGLSQQWYGRIWLNPPFDRYVVGRWIERLAEHGRGTSLLHARCEAGWFEPIWKSASAILFKADRVHFYRPDGTRHKANSGAPPVLAVFGTEDLERLRTSGITGNLVTSWEPVS
jgi:hypothetical protein